MMDCHCSEHRPGEWHSDHDCDCHKHDYPTFTFVVTKVMDENPGAPTVYISSEYMEKLQVKEDDTVKIVDRDDSVLQVRAHPNPWVDTRMISVDRGALEVHDLQLFSQIKLRKIPCDDADSVTLEIPKSCLMTRAKIRSCLDQLKGAVLTEGGEISIKNNKARDVFLKVLNVSPAKTTQLGSCTRIELVDEDGDPYTSPKDTTFEDVGGLEDAIRKVREVVQLPLRHPAIFERLGIDPPRGVLLHGPSGTGKTLIARAVAGETGCYFKSVLGAEIMDKHYGESEAKLRAAFDDAEQNAPAIIFIDEIDALAPRRDTSEGEVERRITAQLLGLMDGLEDRGQVIALAATNLPNSLDPALRRPGRFDREILIQAPDKKGRKEILDIHTKDMPLGGVDLDLLAAKTHGFVGADLLALCQEAGYVALKRSLPGIERTDQDLTEDFLEAVEVTEEDFIEALTEMRPASSRNLRHQVDSTGWDCVAGYKPEKEFIDEMVLWPAKNFHRLSGLGISYLDGLVISGPSGVGKTLLARSLAKESGFNIIEIRGPELISKYMGESERNVRELFRQAREMAPSVVLLDGADAMTASSHSGNEGTRVIDRVVNQLVMELGALNSSKPVIVVAICNRAEDLPPSLRSTGRFGAELPLKLPRPEDREQILDMFLNFGKVSYEGDLKPIIDKTEGLTGGDIKEICRRAILHGVRHSEGDYSDDILSLTVDDVERAMDRWKLTRNNGDK